MNRKTAVYICSEHHNKTSNCERFTIHEEAILNAIEDHFKDNVIDLNLIEFIKMGVKPLRL